MKLIISPAKKMRRNTDQLPCQGMPYFLEEAGKLMEWIRSLSYAEVKEMWSCNDSIAELNYRRFQEMELTRAVTPAVLSYEGIQYQYMAPSVFESGELDYIQKHLRILSGFYGVLKPMDGVVPYRLEMQAQINLEGHKNLYSFWGEKICRELLRGGNCVINLASREYAKAVEPYLNEKVNYITCTFAERKGSKLIQKGTYAKMARGEMVRFLAERRAEEPEELKGFDRLGYVFSEVDSSSKEYVFVKQEEK